MKIYTEERKNRVSLTLLFSGITLIILLVTVVIVAGLLVLLEYLGVLKLGIYELKAGSFILYIVLMSFIIGTILTFVTIRFPLKPVNKILNAFNRLASGDYSARLDFKGKFSKHPSIAELSSSFNKMAEELEQTEMLRADFINNISHEFKTPIVSIAGFAKLLRRGNLSKEEMDEYLDIIEEESMRLSQMATNVLNLTKIDNQNILTDTTRYNLSEQLRTCVLMLERKWAKKNIEFSMIFDECFTEANEDLMMQVWINLFDNAIKFSSDYGTVEVKITETEDYTAVAISNFGWDIPEEKRQRIFNRFYQADESRSTPGNGVGLAVVKKIVELHNGEVGVDSYDGKVTFTVKLPVIPIL